MRIIHRTGWFTRVMDYELAIIRDYMRNHEILDTYRYMYRCGVRRFNCGKELGWGFLQYYDDGPNVQRYNGHILVDLNDD